MRDTSQTGISHSFSRKIASNKGISHTYFAYLSYYFRAGTQMG